MGRWVKFDGEGQTNQSKQHESKLTLTSNDSFRPRKSLEFGSARRGTRHALKGSMKTQREEVGGYLLEKSVCGWWLVDTESEHGDRQWFFKTKHEAIEFAFDVLGAM